MPGGILGEIIYDIVARDRTDEGLSSASQRVADVGLKVGGAMTAVGGSISLITDQYREMNAPLEVSALQLGISSEEMRKLAAETTNVTFPLKSVAATYDLLTRSGMRNIDQIQSTANAFDGLADATNSEASIVAGTLIPAFKAFDIPLEDAGEYMDMFTYLTRNTNVELSDFGTMMKYLAPELQNLDITMIDSVASLKALSDKGIEGEAATRLYRSAVSQADGDVTKFYEALGITKDEVIKYSTEIEDSTGITQEFADAANTQFGTVDKLKQAVSEVTLKYGSMLMPLEQVGGVMAGIGPLMMGVSGIMKMNLIPTVVQFGTVLLTNPIFLIAMAISAVIIILILLEKKFGILTTAAELMGDALQGIYDFLTGIFHGTLELFQNIMQTTGDKMLWLLGPIGLVIYAFKNWEEIITIVREVFNKIFAYLGSLAESFKNAGRRLIQMLIDGVMEKIDVVRSMITNAMSEVRNLLPFSAAKEGPLSQEPDWESYLVKPLKRINITPNLIFGSAAVGNTAGMVKKEYHITITGNYIKEDIDIDRIGNELLRRLEAEG